MTDTLASESLVKLAESLGYNYEPAAIFHDVKQYTLSSVQKWFREEFNIHVYCTPGLHHIDHDFDHYSYQILHGKKTDIDDGSYSSYEDALEAGLRSACMLLKERQEKVST